MATNTGANIFRDILRESPCRMAYLATQQNLTKSSRAKTASMIQKISTRPTTAPISPSSLARAMLAHELLEPAPQQRPTTSHAASPRLDTERLQKLMEMSPSKKPPCRDNNNYRQKPGSTRKPSREPSSERNPRGRKLPGCTPPKQPRPISPQQKPASGGTCKICHQRHQQNSSIPQQWQDRLALALDPPEEDFNRRISAIQSARSKLIDPDQLHQLTLQESLYLINQVHERTPAANSLLADIAPFQTATLPLRQQKQTSRIVFEGGRIMDEDYRVLAPRKTISQTSLRNSINKARPSVQINRIEGPLRLAVYPVNSNGGPVEKIRKF